MYSQHLDLTHPLVWTVENFLAPDECQAFVSRMRLSSLAEAAPVTTASGEAVDTTLRDNTRLTFFDNDLARALWPRLKPYVPDSLRGLQVVGINECFRLYRYQPGQHHYAHWVSPIDLPDGRTSLLTLVIHLNDDFMGGSTNLLQLNRVITPVLGSAVLFQQRVLHEAQDIVSGEKFVLRSEVFFQAGGPHTRGVA